MGLVLSISNILSRLYGNEKQQVRIVMVGLDGAGKTTTLYQLKLGQVVQTIPTIGFNVETVEYKNISFTVYDVGGQTKIRPLQSHYYTNAKGIIFVVDSTDLSRFAEAEDELDILKSNEQLRDANAAILILANKQDQPNALTPIEITQKLGLHKLRGRKWHIQGTSAVQGDGIAEGLEWLSTNIPKE